MGAVAKPAVAKGERQQIVWHNVLAFIVLHAITANGIYVTFVYRPMKTVLFAVVLSIFASIGVTAGAHRLWAHRAYKARLPLRILLALLQTAAGQVRIH